VLETENVTLAKNEAIAHSGNAVRGPEVDWKNTDDSYESDSSWHQVMDSKANIKECPA